MSSFQVPELGDTIFIVLRKQKLIFLHWYHHITVLIYCWYSFSQYTAPARWFVVMNFIVHSIMYTYYAFRALRYNTIIIFLSIHHQSIICRYRVPKIIAMVITSLQLIQMIIGCAVNYMAFNYKQNGKNQYHSFIISNQSESVNISLTVGTLGMQCGVSDTNLKLSLLMYCSYFVLFAR